MTIQARVIRLVFLSCVALAAACGDDGNTPTGTQGGTGDATIAGTGSGTSNNPSTPTSEPTTSAPGSAPEATGTAPSHAAPDTTPTPTTDRTDATTAGPGATTDSSGNVDPSNGTTIDPSAGTTVDPSAGSSGTTGIGSDPIVSIAIVPQNPVVLVKNGVIPPALDFKAIATTEMGDMLEVEGDWTWGRPDAAVINPGNGVFKATGQVGAKDTIGFKWNALEASTSATVKLHDVLEPAPVDPDIKDALKKDPPPHPPAGVLYPHHQTRLIDPGRGGRRIAILGDMYELGQNSAQMHRDLALPLQAAGVDLVYTCGALMKNLYDALPEQNRGAHRDEAPEMAQIVPDVPVPGDVVLVKGSRGGGEKPRMQLVVQAVRALPLKHADAANKAH